VMITPSRVTFYKYHLHGTNLSEKEK